MTTNDQQNVCGMANAVERTETCQGGACVADAADMQDSKPVQGQHLQSRDGCVTTTTTRTSARRRPVQRNETTARARVRVWDAAACTARTLHGNSCSPATGVRATNDQHEPLRGRQPVKR